MQDETYLTIGPLNTPSLPEINQQNYINSLKKTLQKRFGDKVTIKVTTKSSLPPIE